jgi:hypothetical protein
LQEAADFLYLRVFSKQLLILSLVSMLRVAPHQELSQENARVEALSN